ncbi:MAG TPA: hypothetical protein DEQ30_12860 [Porphyromonadaceae bacterium]|nr:hypothetical protein [Porphyromonadaceae bacterium]
MTNLTILITGMMLSCHLQEDAMRNPGKKTVFILGAGFSKADDMPLQSELLKQIFLFFPKDIPPDISFMQLPVNNIEQNVLKYYDVFEVNRQILAKFLVENFMSDEKKDEYNGTMFLVNIESPGNSIKLKQAYKIVSEVNVTLEDLFTFFDKMIIGHDHFQFYPVTNIIDLHKALRTCITFLLSYHVAHIRYDKDTFSGAFANAIFKMRLVSSQKDDNLSIITMNWDTLLDKELYHLSQNHNLGRSRVKVYPDLCFYDHSYNQSDKRIVSTHIKAKGHRNIKLLKLHGSINWLICPYCERVYVDYEDDIALNALSSDCSCSKCKEMLITPESPQMRSILITPTFLKDLNDLHLRNIWHNAFMDLTEANKIVFIGYSFPDADFEMRCLLKKAVRHNTQIDVVLHSLDNPENYKALMDNHHFDINDQNSFFDRLNLPEKRYKTFFGNEAVTLYYNGLEGYIQQEMQI